MTSSDVAVPLLTSEGGADIDSLADALESTLKLDAAHDVATAHDPPESLLPDQLSSSLPSDPIVSSPESKTRDWFETEFSRQFRVISRKCPTRDNTVKPARRHSIVSAVIPKEHRRLFFGGPVPNSSDETSETATNASRIHPANHASRDSNSSQSRRTRYFPLPSLKFLPQLTFEETPELILEDELIPGLTREFFAGNRRTLLSKLKENSCVVLISNGRKKISIDRYAPFRQHPYVTYFTGYLDVCIVVIFCLPNGETEFTLFVEPRDECRLTYTGDRAGCELAVRKFGSLGAFSLQSVVDGSGIASNACVAIQTEHVPDAPRKPEVPSVPGRITRTRSQNQGVNENPSTQSESEQRTTTSTNPSIINAVSPKTPPPTPVPQPPAILNSVQQPSEILSETISSAVTPRATESESATSLVSPPFASPVVSKHRTSQNPPLSATRRSARLAAKRTPKLPATAFDSPSVTPVRPSVDRAKTVPNPSKKQQRAVVSAQQQQDAEDPTQSSQDSTTTRTKRQIMFSPDHKSRLAKEAKLTTTTHKTVTHHPGLDVTKSEISKTVLKSASKTLETDTTVTSYETEESETKTVIKLSGAIGTPSGSATRVLRSASRRARIRNQLNTSTESCGTPTPKPSSEPQPEDDAVQSLESQFANMSLIESGNNSDAESPTDISTFVESNSASPDSKQTEDSGKSSQVAVAKKTGLQSLTKASAQTHALVSPLVSLLSHFENVYFDPVSEDEETSQDTRLSGAVVDALLTLDKTPLSALEIIDRMMFVKQPCEIDLIREAADLTARGYCEILKTLAQDAHRRKSDLQTGSNSFFCSSQSQYIKPNPLVANENASKRSTASRFKRRDGTNSNQLTERRIQRVFERFIEEEGASSMSYPLTVSSGPRNLRLAYTTNRHRVVKEDSDPWHPDHEPSVQTPDSQLRSNSTTQTNSSASSQGPSHLDQAPFGEQTRATSSGSHHAVVSSSQSSETSLSTLEQKSSTVTHPANSAPLSQFPTDSNMSTNSSPSEPTSTLVLIDGGADWPPAYASHGGGGGGGCYASDVTRVFPAGHTKFSEEQRIIMNIANQCLDFVLDRLCPGAVLARIESAVARFAKEKLAEEGIRVTLGTGAFASILVHDLGHPLGMLIHDCGATMRSIKDIPPLEAGVVLAVEPGIYLRYGQDGVPPRFQDIGVRIEDTVLILAEPKSNEHSGAANPQQPEETPLKTVRNSAKKRTQIRVASCREERLCEALSRRCPRTADDIEAFIAQYSPSDTG